MASAGRPAKPTNLKLLHGDDKHDPQRINRREPQPADGRIEPPWPLSPEAQANWDRMAPDRIDKGVLKPWDADAFAQFCEALCEVRQGLQDRYGKYPHFREAVNICMSIGAKFGWTPSDRARLQVGGQQENPKDRLLG